MLARLLDPVCFGLLCCVAGLAWLTRAAWRNGRAVQRPLIAVWIGFGCLWLCSSPWFASLCLRGLQPPATDLSVALAGEPEAERALVVLSGGSRNVYAWVPDSETLDGDTQARLIGAARAYREQGFAYVVVTGIHQEYVDGMAQLLVDLGVPRPRILLDPNARTTRDNAENSLRILAEHPQVKRVVLVTSAAHMPRAAALFRVGELRVTPFPVAYETGLSLKLLPSSDALRRMDIVIHEVLGSLR